MEILINNLKIKKNKVKLIKLNAITKSFKMMKSKTKANINFNNFKVTKISIIFQSTSMWIKQ
jgi:hypothetical protein